MKYCKNNIIERFWDNIEFIPFHSCWEWFGTKASGGYGRIAEGSRGYQKIHLAHRFSYELHKNAIPKGLHIDHLCRNRACVNPNHLEAVTQKENTLRGIGPAALNSKKTHCLNGHEFKNENLYIRPDMSRACKTCKASRQRIKNTRSKQCVT